MTKQIRERIEAIERLGLVVLQVTQQGKHPKLHVSNGKRVLKVTIPGSCSDWRGTRNMVAFLRREFGSAAQ